MEVCHEWTYDEEFFCCKKYIWFMLKNLPDNEKADDGSLEILIGTTDREESSLATQTLIENNEFVIKYFENGRIAISGTDQAMTKVGIKHFLSAYVKKGTYEGALVIDPNLEYHESSTTRTGWKLNLPVYMGGELSSATYNIGSGIKMDSAQGGKMQLIYNTSTGKFFVVVIGRQLIVNNYCVITQFYIGQVVVENKTRCINFFKHIMIVSIIR